MSVAAELKIVMRVNRNCLSTTAYMKHRKAELKQRLVEHLEKEREDLSVLEFGYNIEGREQTDNLEGEDGASVSNTVLMQFIQQQMQQQMQQTKQQGQHIDGTTKKIDIIQENQRILQTHIDEMYQQFEGKIKVLEEKADNSIGQLDARINAQEKDVKNEIKALKQQQKALEHQLYQSKNTPI
uniref:Uncharacterized protein n=1 Tax=Glossina austeni TaxID=7395 RepID=A0A1A9UDK4_GLOAU